MTFVFIAKHRTIWPVAWLCNALGVSRSGFHAWLNRTPSAISRSDEALGQRVKASFPLIMEEAIQTGHSLMDAFRAAGFNNNDAIVAYRSVTCFVAEFVLLENAALEPLYTTGDFDLEYTKGLEIIVAGIENRLSAKPMKALTAPARRPVQTKKPSKPRNNKAPLTA